jgi:UDP-N-acetylmuramyl tripeptide synthase
MVNNAEVYAVPRPTWWCDLAIHAGRVAAGLSRRVGLGTGSIIGGRVSLLLYPGALRRLAAGRRVMLVSGTNGKTTTSHMLAAALRTQTAVAHNASGANMADGAVAALAESPHAPFAVLEVDELHLASVARQCDPASIVLLNLTRDQLDRVSEVRQTAAKIGAALAALPHTTVFANADDPMTVWTALHSARPPVWVAGGSSWRADSVSCPRCGEIVVETPSGWHCTCGLSRPEPSWWLNGQTAWSRHSATPLSLVLPGRVNLANALMALAAAAGEHVALDRAAAALSQLDSIAGRYVRLTRGRHTIRLLLAKNPAGWDATLSMLEPSRPLIVVINAREADGTDTSWLWDVDFEAIGDRPLVASGERAADLGVRFSYADLAHHTAPDPLAALNRLPAGEVDVVANYTAFYVLWQRLSRSA